MIFEFLLEFLLEFFPFSKNLPKAKVFLLEFSLSAQLRFFSTSLEVLVNQK